ncbi:hypothetical protein BLOT_016469 [Blomia tropicalis]|nr:hypothetical protein BLOT_016469 [Blomia tropicalis]
MLIDTRLNEWPKPLQNVWNISETIGPNRRKLLGAFNYDNQLVLIFEDVIEIFNLKTRTMSKGDKVINVNNMAILSDQHGRGGIFLSSNNKSSNIKKWQYQMVTFEHKILWPNREKFFVYERKSTTDQRILDYSQIELILLSEDNSLYRSYQVDWKWAQGYIFTGEDGRIVWHLFTNLGVYLFDPPDQQNPEISFMIDPKRLISLRSLRVNFSDYFTCSKNDPAGWNQFFRVLLYMRSEKETVNRSFRYKVVLWLFSAHFLVSIIMIFIIFIINFSYRFSYRRILRPQLIGPLSTNLTNNSKSNVSIATSEETVQQAVDTKVVTV